MTTLSKSLLALALTSFVAQAHTLNLALPGEDQASLTYLEPLVNWSTANWFDDGDDPGEAVFRNAAPWQPETLRFSDVYSLSFGQSPAPANEDAIPYWAVPLYDSYIVGSNMFAPATYWMAGLFILVMASLPKILGFRKAAGSGGDHSKMCCVLCDSHEIRRVPVGNGVLAEVRRALGQRAFRCNSCTYKFFRRWDYEGSETASRARLS